MKRRWVLEILRVSWSIWAAVRIWRYINALLDYTIWINNVYKANYIHQIIFCTHTSTNEPSEALEAWCAVESHCDAVSGSWIRCWWGSSALERCFFLWSCSASFRGLGGLLHSLRLNTRRYNMPFTPSHRFWDLSTAIEDRRQTTVGVKQGGIAPFTWTIQNVRTII